MLRTAARIANLTYWEEDFASNRIVIPDEGYRVLGLPQSPNSQARTFDELIQFIHPDDRIRLQESRRRTIEGTPSKVTVRMVRGDGEVRHIEIAAEATRDEAQSPVRAVGAIQDISSRVQAERALHESHQRLQLALQATGLGPWEWDLITNETKFWPAWTQQIGYEAGELPNRYEEWESRLHPDDRDRVLINLRDYLDGRSGEYDPEFRLRHKDGTYRWIATRGAMLHDASGTPTHMLGCHLDITERKRLVEKFLHAQRMDAIGQFAGGVAHDFNNILTVIYGESDWLLSALPVTDPNREMVIAIRRASERAAALTSQLLTFSHRDVVGPKVLDLNEVILDNERMLRRLIGEDIGLTTTLDPSAEPVRVDPGQASQVIMNLAVNARDAMPVGGKLTIETSGVALDESAAQFIADARPGRYVVLAVSDTGVGMTREVMAHIFEPFFTTKGPQKGTGLGLATVYGIVQQSGGFSDVYSEPGHGTTFKLYFFRSPTSALKNPGFEGKRRQAAATKRSSW